MFKEGQLLRFNNFVFKNGANPKPKFFVVLRNMDDDILMASLPTSKDHIPDSAAVVSGCVNIPERCVSAFVFAADQKVTEQFAFPLRTFIYGEQVDEYSQRYLDSMPAGYDDLGILDESLFADLRDCLKHSPLIKRKYSRLL